MKRPIKWQKKYAQNTKILKMCIRDSLNDAQRYFIDCAKSVLNEN